MVESTCKTNKLSKCHPYAWFCITAPESKCLLSVPDDSDVAVRGAQVERRLLAVLGLGPRVGSIRHEQLDDICREVGAQTLSTELLIEVLSKSDA